MSIVQLTHSIDRATYARVPRATTHYLMAQPGGHVERSKFHLELFRVKVPLSSRQSTPVACLDEESRPPCRV